MSAQEDKNEQDYLEIARQIAREALEAQRRSLEVDAERD